MTSLRSISIAVAALAAMAASPASAQQQPTGVWIDHTGRGAVEIKPCGEALCGHVVWIKEAKNKQACRTQIIGNVRQVGPGTWDRGWILDPDDNSRYSVELKPIGEDRLRVTGYMGSKLFSETMTWRRAPADLQRCDGVDTAKPAAPAIPPAATVTAPPAPATRPSATVTAPAAPAQTSPLPSAPLPPARVVTPVPPVPAIMPPPVEIMPLPQREATAPQPEIVAPPARPAIVPPPGPSETAPAPAGRPAASPERDPAAPEVVEEEAQPKPTTRQRQANSKRSGGGSRQCTLDLPYITIKYPCDAF